MLSTYLIKGAFLILSTAERIITADVTSTMLLRRYSTAGFDPVIVREIKVIY